MRPVRLDIEGFTSFRDPTTVDFTDADYFVLVGPTGSGKSSLIDAMAFALYGSVPRYDDRRLVAPVISQGRVEARVSFEFALGPDVYRAVRVVRLAARGKGATTKEARLERIDGEVLAGDADAVTRAVEELIGLGFDHFTKCVVLPQGAFAEFLHDKPRDRQDLLIKLLDLGLYERLAAAAHQRAQAAAGRAASRAELLERPPLLHATADAVAVAHARVAELDGLRARISEAQPEIERLEAVAAAARAEATALADRAAALGAVGIPGDIAAIAEAVVEARAASAAASDKAADAEKATLVAEEALARLPAQPAVEAAVTAHAELAALASRTETGRAAVESLRAASAAADQSAADASAAATKATLARDDTFVRHQADGLARHLVVGEECIVCRQPVQSLPTPRAAALDLDAADAAVGAAAAASRDADDRRRAAGEKRARAEELLATLTARAGELERAVVDWPTAASASDVLAAIVTATEAVTRARDGERAGRAAAKEAAGAVASAERVLTDARARFDQIRDAVAPFGPPPAERIDLAADWAALSAWAADAAATASVARAEVDERAASASASLASLTRVLADACGAAGVPETAPLGEAVAAALSRAGADAEAVARALADADALRAEIAVATEEAAVARSLSQHLNASHFEKWLLDEALGTLVEGATLVLRELSGDAYSLTVDAAGSFAVIDHRNTDAVRSARTLSGGETFLASLALALALADRVADLAAGGTARLEAIFLDEGFGSLDTDTLETVATAIESLAADGRVVGLVTHVRELADRIPVRFEVTKGITSSSVARVET
jgi:exonuclease SbcC